MYANRPWTIRQYAGFSTAEESNRFYRANLAAGQMGLSVAFDLATHRGYDSDHPRVVGDVGKAGVAIDSVEDMKILFDGIPLDKMSVSMTMNGAVLPVLAGYIVAAEEQGVAPGQALRDHPERHPQGVHGPQHLYLPARPLDADRRRHHRVHGAAHAEIQLDLDLRLSHAGGRGDLRCRSSPSRSPTGSNMCAPRCRAGLEIDEFAPRLSFFFGIGMNFFMEIAKLRAARLLWARLMQQFDPKNPASLALRTHCQTSGVSLTEQDPLQQHHPHHDRGDGGGARRHAVAAHQLLRRGAGPADPVLGRASPATPSSSSPRRPASRMSSTRSAAAITSRA